MTLRQRLYFFIAGIRPATIEQLASVIAFIISIFIDVIRFIVVAGLVFLFMHSCQPAHAAGVSIPRAANQYKSELTRAARLEFGLNAPVALIAAQIHTESLWRSNATSHVGAQGLAQFMPATAAWLPQVAPQTGTPAPFNSGWALRAACAYDKYLYLRIHNTASDCDHWVFTLYSYNGGLGWVNRDRALAAKKGINAGVCFGVVELVNAGRRASAFKENRTYARRIFAMQEMYEAAGWGQGVHCD